MLAPGVNCSSLTMIPDFTSSQGSSREPLSEVAASYFCSASALPYSAAPVVASSRTRSARTVAMISSMSSGTAGPLSIPS